MKKCRACGRDMLTSEDFPRTLTEQDEKEDLAVEFLDPQAEMCHDCVSTALAWGVEKWLAAGAPGAKRA